MPPTPRLEPYPSAQPPPSHSTPAPAPASASTSTSTTRTTTKSSNSGTTKPSTTTNPPSSTTTKASTPITKPPTITALLKNPPPLRPLPFDPYNCTGKGHQRAENRLASSGSWRDSRTRKLTSQFSDTTGAGGEGKLFDSVGAGSEWFGRDGRKENGCWSDGAEGARREMGNQGIRGWLVGGKKELTGEERRAEKTDSAEERADEAERRRILEGDEREVAVLRAMEAAQLQKRKAQEEATASTSMETHLAPAAEGTKKSNLFRGCTFYVNGSTDPASSGVSDHRLRALIVQHRGGIALGLARRRVSHVVIGTPCSSSLPTPSSSSALVGADQSSSSSRDYSHLAKQGAGGGLAAGKIQKENLRRVGGVGGGVRYVGVGWVLECVRVGKRVREFGGIRARGNGKGGGIQGYFG